MKTITIGFSHSNKQLYLLNRKNNMSKKLIVGFSRPKAFFEPFSWLIRLVQWTSYSHAYVRFYLESTNQWIVLQASGLKVNMVTWEHFRQIEVIAKEFEFDITDRKNSKIISWSFNKLVLPYNLLSVFGIGLILLFKTFGIKIGNPFSGKGSLFCSELADIVVSEFLGAHINELPYDVTPKDLFTYLEKYHKLNE